MPEESVFVAGSGSSSTASIQPMGDYTTVGQNDFKSGNPGYTDASGGPSTPKVPNGDPHMMQKKGGKNYAKNKKKAEFLKLFEGKTFDYSEAGYVETPIPKQCKTCKFFQNPNVCNLPMSGPVDPDNGCCNFWEPNDGDMDDMECMEALTEALAEAKSTKLQTFIFDKDKFSADDAKSWLKKHGKASDLDSSGPSHRARQKDPGDFEPKSFRTIPITKGVKAVIGKPKSEMSEAKSSSKMYCRSCSEDWPDGTVTCKKCGSMEFTTGTPMSKFSLAGP